MLRPLGGPAKYSVQVSARARQRFGRWAHALAFRPGAPPPRPLPTAHRSRLFAAVNSRAKPLSFRASAPFAGGSSGPQAGGTSRRFISQVARGGASVGPPLFAPCSVPQSKFQRLGTCSTPQQKFRAVGLFALCGNVLEIRFVTEQAEITFVINQPTGCCDHFY